MAADHHLAGARVIVTDDGSITHSGRRFIKRRASRAAAVAKRRGRGKEE